MIWRHRLGACFLSIAASLPTLSAADEPARGSKLNSLEGVPSEIYKQVGDTKLQIYIFQPADHRPTDRRPAIVFFFGGGWSSGTPTQFAPHCRYLASRGMVAMAAEYRIASQHQSTVRDAVEDGRSAVRWARQNADRLGIDPERLGAGGGSAGGHVAACTALISDLDASDEDQTISAAPQALILFNPVVTIASDPSLPPEAELLLSNARKRLGASAEALSPLHHVRADLPPTIVFFGTRDSLLPSTEEYEKRVSALGNVCELRTYEGVGHGFFNFGRDRHKLFLETVAEMDRFLAQLGWLKGSEKVADWLNSSLSKSPNQ